MNNKIDLTENTHKVQEKMILKKNLKGQVIETPKGMFRRAAKTAAKAEKKRGNEEYVKLMEDLFCAMMTDLAFLPNSPTLMNSGRELGQLTACFVIPVEDTMETIFASLKNAVLIHKSGGGTGFSFSRLRPRNSRVGTTGGVASGPVSFMKIFITATEQVKQGGTPRPYPSWGNGQQILSCSDAIAETIGQCIKIETKQPADSPRTYPDCGDILELKGRCFVFRSEPFPRLAEVS